LLPAPGLQTYWTTDLFAREKMGKYNVKSAYDSLGPLL
jgi:hypothetical protein